MAESATPRLSLKYPQNYGDFIIRSSDGLVCYFSSAILARASIVFRDILASGQGDHLEVTVTEQGDVVEAFLGHLDAGSLPPPIDVKTIRSLLAIADKYQVDSIMNWFDKEVITEHRDHITGKAVAAIVTTHPLLVLSLSSQCGRDTPIRCALRELAGCNEHVLTSAEDCLDLELFFEVCKLRDDRIKNYRKLITTIAGYHPCYNCKDADHAEWIMRLINAVTRAPNWDSFFSAYKSRNLCSRCVLPMSITSWQKDFQSKEALLPQWPPRTRVKTPLTTIPGGLEESSSNVSLSVLGLALITGVLYHFPNVRRRLTFNMF